MNRIRLDNIDNWAVYQIADHAEHILKIEDRRDDCESLLLAAEKRISESVDWCCLARVWSGISGKEENVRKCLKNAEWMGAEDYEFTMCAECWIEYLGERSECERILRQRGPYFEHGLKEAAEIWLSRLKSKAGCRQMLVAVGQRSQSWTAHYEACRIWKSALGDHEAAMRALVDSEKYIEFDRQIETTAKCWKEEFNELEKAKAILLKGERLIKYFHEWNRYFEYWRDIVGEKGARSSILRAESNAKTPHEFEVCALAWLELINDSDNGRKCLVQSVGCASNISERARIAKIYASQIWGGEKEAEDLLKGVFSEEEEPVYVWLEVANTLYGFPPDRNKQLVAKTLDVAAGLCREVYEWLNCAKNYSVLLQDNVKVERCLLEAEKIASSHDDWMDISAFWKLFLQDSERSNICREKAEQANEE